MGYAAKAAFAASRDRADTAYNAHAQRAGLKNPASAGFVAADPSGAVSTARAPIRDIVLQCQPVRACSAAISPMRCSFRACASIYHLLTLIIYNSQLTHFVPIKPK